jgi:hypothetical protein
MQTAILRLTSRPDQPRAGSRSAHPLTVTLRTAVSSFVVVPIATVGASAMPQFHRVL